MKKIITIFITFSGIYSASGQNTGQGIDSSDIIQKVHADKQPGKIDSLKVKETVSFRLFPNPAKNKVEIEINGFEPGYIQVLLLDNTGNIVRNDRRFVFKGNETIILMFSEKPGIYFLLLKQNEINLKSRLIIQ